MKVEEPQLTFSLASLLILVAALCLLLGLDQLPPSPFHTLVVLSTMYISRPMISTMAARSRTTASVCYCVVLALLIPYLYRNVIVDWDSQFVKPAANYIGAPIAIFGVCTLSFFRDIVHGGGPSLNVYTYRSVFELCVLMPLWCIIYLYIEFFLLQWSF